MNELLVQKGLQTLANSAHSTQFMCDDKGDGCRRLHLTFFGYSFEQGRLMIAQQTNQGHELRSAFFQYAGLNLSHILFRIILEA